MSYSRLSARDWGEKPPADFNNKGDILVNRKPRGRSIQKGMRGSHGYYVQRDRHNEVPVVLWNEKGEIDISRTGLSRHLRHSITRTASEWARYMILFRVSWLQIATLG